MLVLSISQLASIAVLLALAGLWLRVAMGFSPVAAALGVLSLAMAAAAGAATVIVWAMPSAYDGLSTANLDRLNDLMDESKVFADRWTWRAVVLVGLSLCAAALTGWMTLKRSTSIRFRRFAISASAAKVALAVLASGSFVVSGMGARAEETSKQAAAEKEKLTELQYAVFEQVKRTAAVAVIEAVLSQASTQAGAGGPYAVRASLDAYRVVAPYLHPSGSAAPSKGPARTGNPTDKTADSQPAPPDVSTRDAENVAAAFTADEKSHPRDALANDIAAAALDANASDLVREHLLKIENPVISELLAAFMDPLVFEPVRKLVQERAVDAMKKGMPPSRLRAAMAAAATAVVVAIAARLERASQEMQPIDGLHVGVPEWAEVRAGLRRGVAAGLNGKALAVQDEARAVVGRFLEVHAAANALFRGPNGRTLGAEAVFSKYTESHPSYAALWGYAVISLVPRKYEETLSRISQEDFVGSKKFKLLKEVLSLAAAGDAEAIGALKRLGIDGPYSGARYSDAALSKIFYEAHGPYPIDGYMLYSLEWKGQSATYDAAARERLKKSRGYFQGPSVEKAVDRFCPQST